MNGHIHTGQSSDNLLHAASKQPASPTEDVEEGESFSYAALAAVYAALGIAIYVAPHSVSSAGFDWTKGM